MSATIYGYVNDANTGAVITTATVVAPPYTVSNNQGAYIVTTPGAAKVKLTASAPGYTDQSKTITVANGQTKNVNFNLLPV